MLAFLSILLPSLKAQEIEVTLYKGDFTLVNEMEPFNYHIIIRNKGKKAFTYYSTAIRLSFFDALNKKWIEADDWELNQRLKDFNPLAKYGGPRPSAPPMKTIPPNSFIILESKSALYKVKDIKSELYTPIDIAEKYKVKASITFELEKEQGKKIKVIDSSINKLKLAVGLEQDKACIAWLKQQEAPYYLFQRVIWSNGYGDAFELKSASTDNKGANLLASDEYILQHFPNSSFAPWAKLHQASYIDSYERANIHPFIDQNIKTIEDIIATPLLDISQYRMLVSALFFRINSLSYLNGTVPFGNTESMENGEWFTEDLKINAQIADIKEKLFLNLTNSKTSTKQ